jgi:hypothetical protein
MKKIITMFVLLFAAIFVQATVRTVSNIPSTLAQYNTIQAAIDASANGDTIYVHGSPNDYAAFSITDIRLVIIGPGWSPDKNLPFTAEVNGAMTITGSLSSNTEIQGLTFLQGLNIYTGTHPNGLKFIRNEFRSYIYIQEGGTYTGYLFEGNYFNTGYVYAGTSTNYVNFLFQNNVFYYTTASIHGFTNSTNVLFNHNLWYGPASGSADCFTNNCRFLSIANNVFVRRNATTANSFSTFNNNITYLTTSDLPWTLNSNTDAGGNVSAANPLLADQTAVNAGTNNPLLNFTIASGPANNTGSDLKDMGLLYDPTGSLNWTTSRGSRLPFIFSMNITNPTIPVGGTLNVNVEARKNN